MRGPFKPQGCARAAGMKRIPGLASIPGFVDPYSDFPVSANLVDAWLAHPTYLFKDTACTDPITAASQVIKGWRGRNGNIFVQPTTGNAPVSDLTSSIWSLTFASANSRYMTVTLAVAQPSTLYYVAFNDNAPGSSYQFDGIDAVNRNASIIDFSSNPTSFAGTLLGPAVTPATISAFSYVFNGVSSSIRSSTGTVSGDAGTLGVAGFTLAARYNLVQFYDKRVRAMLVYSAAHSTGTQDTILAWLRTNFGAN